MPQPPPHPPRRARTAAAVVVAVVAACTASCGDAAAPLGDDASLVSLCTTVAGTSPVVAGDEFLRNEGTVPLTVDDVRLVGAAGLVLRDAFLLPVEDRTLLGTSALPPTSPVWQQRREAVGAQLAPGETWNLALALERDGEPARFTDVEVAVTADGDTSTARLGYALTVTSTTPCRTSQG